MEPRPLTLFVGENNTGKSYLATLLWGLLALHGALRLDRSSATYASCEKKLIQFLEVGSEVPRPLPDDERKLLIQLFNETLAKNQKDLLARSFNAEDSAGNAISDGAPVGRPRDHRSLSRHW